MKTMHIWYALSLSPRHPGMVKYIKCETYTQTITGPRDRDNRTRTKQRQLVPTYIFSTLDVAWHRVSHYALHRALSLTSLRVYTTHHIMRHTNTWDCWRLFSRAPLVSSRSQVRIYYSEENEKWHYYRTGRILLATFAKQKCHKNPQKRATIFRNQL